MEALKKKKRKEKRQKYDIIYNILKKEDLK